MTWNHHDLAARIDGAKRQPDGSYKARCLAHNDPVASLHISAGDVDPVVVYCAAGCDKTEVWRRCLDLMGGKKPAPAADTAPRKSPLNTVTQPPYYPSEFNHHEFGAPSIVYEYKTRDGNTWFYNCRFETPTGKEHRPFTFKQAWDGSKAKWYWAAPDRMMRTPYRYETLSEDKSIPVMISEGEKAADAAAQLLPELVHLAYWGGTNNILYTNWNDLTGRAVWLVPDADKVEPGFPLGKSAAAFEKLAKRLKAIGCTVHLCSNVTDSLRHFVTAISDYKGFDAADALEIGWSREKFIEYIDAANPEKSSFAVQDFPEIAHGVQDFSTRVQDFPENPAYDAGFSAEIVQPVQDFPQNPASDTTPQAGFSENPAMTPAAVQDFAEISENLARAIKIQHDKDAKFLPLGYDQENYYYLSRATKQVKCVSIPNHKKNFFLSLVPSSTFWESFVPPKKTGPDWDKVIERMMELCTDAGLFTEDLKRGRGAWFDNNHVVLHLGNRLIVDGAECDILTRPGRYVYELSPPMEGPGKDAMTDTESAALLDLCRLFSWERDVCASYLAGWVALAPVCGALDWRPHIWITGAKGTGKSTIEERFILPLLGKTVRYFQGMSTEAGIRQTLHQDALPVMIDEGESQNERGRARMDAIMEMMRQASSNSEALTVKGGATGKATAYHIRSMFCLASIGVNIKNAADQSRITKLSLRRSAPEHWPVLRDALTAVTPDTSRRLIARTVKNIPVIRDNAKLLSTVIASVAKVEQRVGDQYGTLLAGAVSLMHGRRLTESEATAMAEMHAAEFTTQADNIEHDENQCLDHLLQKSIRCDRSSGTAVMLSVGDLITIASKGGTLVSQPDAQRILKMHGIKVDPPYVTVKIARSHPQLGKLFEGTPWQAGWCQYMLRLPGSCVASKTRFGGSPTNTIELPITLMEGEQDAADTAAMADADSIGF